ncbi:phosphoribosylamine--glycine ligase [Mollicutes bacterium LVI A0039]|nr:phosphoribosylamine--glycine ligase [Mollicutes bacterium LVI A0039]
MNILIIGSGGREHSLFTKVKLDPRVNQVFMLGENGAIDPTFLIKDVDGLDFKQVYDIICKKEIAMTIVGPEIYLEAGIVDYLRAHGCPVIGTDKYCAQLESSKKFAKEIMATAHIPTAKYKYVTDPTVGLEVCLEFGYPVVLKFDGLAAGKGVLVCESPADAERYFDNVLNKRCFGKGGIVIEECLVGEEYSVFAVVSGNNYSILPVAQDYKRAYDNDLGPNTGGMGANTTSKYDDQLPFIEDRILKPLLSEFIERGYKYTGFLYIGLMQTIDGPKVIEFNVRMGDPETQIVMQKLDSSLLEVIEKVYGGENFIPEFKTEEYVGVVIAASDYPNQYEKDVILELNESMRPTFHMGTKNIGGTLYSTGGRVMMVTSGGETVEAARNHVYQKLATFKNDKLFYRNDIGHGRV